MGTSLGWMVLIAVGQAPAGDDYYSSATAASRELSRQVEFLQRSFATIPGPSEGRGLYKQVQIILIDTNYLRQQIKEKASREQLYLAFAKVDEKLNTLLDNLQGFAKWVPAVGMGVKNCHAALHDTQFALFSSDEAPERQSSVAYRQILVLEAKVEHLQSLARYVFDEMDSLPAWNADFKELRGAIGRLQKAQKGKAGSDVLKSEMADVNRIWDKQVAKVKDLSEGQYLLLISDFARADVVFDRLSKMFGIEGRRALLRDPLP